jgi:hypothetical protein
MQESLKTSEALGALEDLLSIDEDWGQRPDNIQMAFRATLIALKNQTYWLEKHSELLDRKVEKEELKKAFKLKANTVDVEESMDRVGEALETKISIEDLEGILTDYVHKNELPGGQQTQGLQDPSPKLATALMTVEARLDKLEQMALSLEAEDPQVTAKEYVTKKEWELFERGLQECVKVEELRDFSERVVTIDEVEGLINNAIEAELARRIQLLELQTKEQFKSLTQELESRIDLEEFASIRKDLERVARECIPRVASPANVEEDLANLQNRIAVVEPMTNVIVQLKNDFKQLSSIQKEIKEELDEIGRDIEELRLTSRANELEGQLSSSIKAIETKVRKLEVSDKRTQEVLEILSKSKLVEREKEKEDSERNSNQGLQPPLSGGTYRATLIEQMDEIKGYVDKKIKRFEISYSTRQDLEALEDKQEEFEKQSNLIFDAIKDMVGELSKKVKNSSREIEEKIEKHLANNVNQKRSKDSDVFPIAAIDFADGKNNKAKEEKLKSLDNLILKVSALVEKKQQEDKERVEMGQRVQKLEDAMETKADKTRVCNLLDKKAEISDVNKALLEIHAELDKRKDNPLSSPNDVLLSKLPAVYQKSALWLWRNNHTQRDLVLWDNESFNSEPNSLIWDRHKTGIVLVQPGLYEISFGFFGSTRPHVDLLLNDETILTSKPAKQKEKSFGQFEVLHTSGNVTGLTCIEYVIVPAKARLSVQAKASSVQEGFLLVKKV